MEKSQLHKLEAKMIAQILAHIHEKGERDASLQAKDVIQDMVKKLKSLL